MSAKVLVALDPAAPRDDALDAAASMLAGNLVELTGLFVEDVRLLHAAGLPCTLEITSLGPRRFDEIALERQMKVLGEHVRRTFERAAERLGVQHSFRIARGDVVHELDTASRECDLLIVGRAGRRAGTRSWLGATVHRVYTRSRCTVAFVQERWPTGRTVLVLPTPGGIELARRIAGAEQLPLALLSVGEEAVRHRVTHARVCPVASVSASELARAAAEVDARALVLPADLPELTEEFIADLLRRLRCALILVR